MRHNQFLFLSITFETQQSITINQYIYSNGEVPAVELTTVILNTWTIVTTAH